MYLLSLIKNTEEENRKAILKLIEPNPDARIIDLGCGDGKLSLRIKDKAGAKGIYGIDTGEKALKDSRTSGVEIFSADLNKPLPIEDKLFDIVHANQIIEHLVETDLFVREIYRILKPGGYVVVSTPNLSSLHNLVSLVFGKQPSTAHVSNEVVLGNSLDPQRGIQHSRSHFRIFTPSALRDLFVHYGFEVDVLVGAGFYPLPMPLSSFLARIDKTHSVYITIKAKKRENLI